MEPKVNRRGSNFENWLLALIVPSTMMVCLVTWAEPEAIGPFQINLDTSEEVGRAAVAAGGSEFVVVWHRATGTTEYGTNIYGRRLDRFGGVIGGELQVNSYTSGDQLSPRVVAGEQGFAVVWVDESSREPGRGIFGRRFDTAGQPIGDEFQVNTWTPGDQFLSSAMLDAQNRLIVVWMSLEQDGIDRRTIYGRIFDPSGLPLTGEIRLGASADMDQGSADVATGPGDGFVVVWYDFVFASGPPSSVQARFFDASGVPTTGDLLISSGATNEFLVGPRVARRSDGDYVAVWYDQEDDDNVFGRRFSADGTPQGDSFQVSDNPEFLVPIGLDIGVHSNDNFTVVWSPGGYSIQARRFRGSGASLGEAITVASAPDNLHSGFTSNESDFLVVWGEPDSLEPGRVFGKLYHEVFGDGFEAGDLSAWSASSEP